MSNNHSHSKEMVEELLDQNKSLVAEIQKLRIENAKMKLAIKTAEITDDTLAKISDAEAICIEQIMKLKEQSNVRMFTGEDAKILDTLHRNLLMARGKLENSIKKSKAKNLSIDELVSIAKSQ
jgi:hypothetical protein